MRGWHIGRAFSGTVIEDECPCPKAACGLVLADERDPACEQHGMTKTMRQGHSPEHCPARQALSEAGDNP